MEYKNLRGTGLITSRLALGTMNIQSLHSDNDAITLIQHALDRGINVIDTAEVYGRSEEIIGKSLSPSKRDSTIIISKVFGMPLAHNLNACGLNRKHICKAIDSSLLKLKTDYIDILFLHGMDSTSPIEEALTVMDASIRAGKIRYYGLSNFTAWKTVEILWKCDQMKLIKPVVSQNIYNLLTRDIESELIPCLMHFNIGLLVYNTLAGGFLSGKYNNGIPEGSRFFFSPSYIERYVNENNRKALDDISALASLLGISMVELSLRWCLENDVANCAVVGVSSCQQLDDLVRITENYKLPAFAMDHCDEIWHSLSGSRQFYGRFFKRV